MILRTIFRSPRFYTSQFRAMSTSDKVIHFGPYEVTEQVFYNSSLCYALVNIKPILPGHVLVVPYRSVQRLTDLTTAEVTDVFTTVQKVQRMLARLYFKSPGSDVGKPENGSFNVALQDGKESGQTVPHVHCHIIPRTKEQPPKGDEIYDILQGEKGNVGGGLWDKERPKPVGKFPTIEDIDRHARSAEEMKKEAVFYREQMAFVENQQ